MSKINTKQERSADETLRRFYTLSCGCALKDMESFIEQLLEEVKLHKLQTL